MRWLVVIVVIAIAAFFGYRYLNTESGQQLAEQAGQAMDQAAEQVGDAVEGAADKVEQATGEATDSAEQAAESAGQATEEAADTAADTAQSAADSAGEAADSAGEAAEQAADSAQQAAESAGQATEEAADTAADTAQSAAESAEQATAALTVGGVDLGKELGTTVSDATSALQGITDKASAEAALPSLEGAKTKLDELGGKVEQLPASAKESLASLLGDMLPEMQDLVNKVEGMEGVGPVVKPTLDSIMTTLNGWAKEPA